MSSNGLDGGAFHPGRPGLKKLLGDLEADIMQAVWNRSASKVTVREIHDDLVPVRKVAYTTVMTVMGNLANKGILLVERQEKAHVYQASQSYEAFTSTAVSRIVNELLRDFADPALACFTRAIEERRP